MTGPVAAWVCLWLQTIPHPAPALDPAAHPGARRRATIAAVGDIMFGRYKIDDEGERSYRPVVAGEAFAAVAPMIGAADIAFANVESRSCANRRRSGFTRG